MAGDAAGPRRHRRARLGDPPAPARSGRPPATWRASPTRSSSASASASSAGARTTCARSSSGPRAPPGEITCPECGGELSEPRQFNLMFETHIGPGGGAGVGGLPAPGDGAGDLHQLQERAAVRAQEAAVRDRPDRQVLPQRDHPRQLHLPHPRVRADGDGVLRPARRRGGVAPALDGGADALVHRARHPPRPPASARARRRRALPLLERDHRRRVPLPDRLVRARGDRQPRRLRPHPARQVLRREARVLRPADAGSATSPT